MDDDSIKNINEYLKILKNEYSELNLAKIINQEKAITRENKKLIYILGNTSCDLDSFISCLFLSIFRNLLIKTENLITKNLRNSKVLYIPIFNCNSNDFCDRLDIYFLLKKYDIAIENLIFINDTKLIEDFASIKYAVEGPKDESNTGKNHKLSIYQLIFGFFSNIKFFIMLFILQKEKIYLQNFLI